MSKKNRCFLSAILLCAIPVTAQVNTGSPYSRFGLGELSKPGFAYNLALGGTGIGLRTNNQINYMNPASYSAIDTMSFLFDFGLQGSQTTYIQNSLESEMINYNIHHIAVGFGITKNWKASIGVVPYSSVGYNIVRTELLADALFLNYNYMGNGGLNRFFIGNSVRFFNHFSLGLNLGYIFGNLNYTNSIDFPATSNAANTVNETSLNIRDMIYDFGFQYHNTFGDKFFVTLGAVYNNETKLKTLQTIVQTSYFPGTKPNLDSIIIDPAFAINSDSLHGETLFPRNMGIGVSFGIKNKLMFAGDFSSQDWSKSLIPGKNDSLVNSNSINFGLEYTPNDQALRGYYNRIHYRFGGYYSNTYLRIREEQLQDYGMSFGVGLPFRNTKSSFNLGFIVGQRGTTKNNLIKESYGMVNFGLTFHDFWFFKRKFD